MNRADSHLLLGRNGTDWGSLIFMRPIYWRSDKLYGSGVGHEKLAELTKTISAMRDQNGYWALST